MAAKTKKKLTPLEQRDRRAKLMLAVLGVLLLAVLGFVLPGMLGGSSPSAVGSSTGSAPGVVSVPVSPNIDVSEQAGSLSSFSHFAAKDPFHALATLGPGPTATTGASTGRPNTAKSAAPTAKKTPTKSLTFSVQKTPSAAAGPLVPAVVLELNGKRRTVTVGSAFPQAHPVFRLVSVGSKSVWISLVGGSFSAGKQTLQIDPGHPVRLVNTTAGIDYAIRIVRVTTAPRIAASSTASTPANDTAASPTP